MSVANTPILKVRMLGPSEIMLGNRVLGRGAWKGRKARTLLLVLLNASGYQIHREQLLDILWPDLDLSAGNNALYKTLHSLRRTLEPEIERGRGSRYIETRAETVGIVPGAPVWSDVKQFRELTSKADSADPDARPTLLRRALELHRGPYLADEPYADWVAGQREALRTEREQAVLALAVQDRNAGDPLATVPYLEALLTTDPTVEPIHRSLMLAYAAGGQRELALRQFERCREILDRELGDEPEPQTSQLSLTIRDQVADDGADLNIVPGSRGFLPALPSRTVGRDEEIERLSSIVLEPDTRLVTVVGTGGVGKTRLATATAHRIRSDFPAGAHFVPLAPVTDPDLLFDAIATALRLHDDPTSTKREQVISHLRLRRALLVLDNLEQLEAAAPSIADLLEACSSLTVLATSRIPLRLRAERLLRLNPLSLPDPTADLHSRHGATELFWQILQALDATSLDRNDERSIVDLCIHLDGLPLAIELAAARCDEHSPAAVLAQMQEHSQHAVLHDGPRDLPVRQQSLYQVVRWSYDLLSVTEQHLFRQMALFPGGIESDILRQLADDDAESTATSLAEASLAQWTIVDGVRRLTMLQTIREVAYLLLEEAEELTDGRKRQGRFYRNLATTAAAGRDGTNQLDVLARFRRELDSLRAVLDWAVTDVTDTTLSLEVMTDTAWLWQAQGLTREGFDRLGQAMETASSPPTVRHVLGAAWLGTFAYRLAMFDTARQKAREARELATQVGAPIGILHAGRLASQLLQRDSAWDDCIALNTGLLPLAHRTKAPYALMDCQIALGVAWRHKSRLDIARVHLAKALAIAHDHGNHLHASRILSIQTEIAYDLSDFASMQTLLARTEQTATLVGDLETLAWTAYHHTALHVEREDYLAAAAAALQASSLFAELGSSRMVGGALITHALNLAKAECYSEAIVAFQTAIELVDTTGHEHDVLSCVEEVGFLAIGIGKPADGLSLLSAFRSELERLGEGISEYEEVRLNDQLAAARALLPNGEADAAEADGRAMSIDTAMELARTVCMPITMD